MLMDFMVKSGEEVTDMLSAYKKLGEYSYQIGPQWYEQTVGKKVDINSVAAYKKMYADLANLWNNLEYSFEFTTSAENCILEVGSDYLDYIQFTIDFGDNTPVNTDEDFISHTYAKQGVYNVLVKVNKIKDYQNNAFTSPTEVPFFINVIDTEHSSCKCLKGSMWFPYSETSSDRNVWYIATVTRGRFNSNLEKASNTEPAVIYYGDSTLPYFSPQNGMGDYITENPGIVEEVYVQTIGTDFSEIGMEYSALKTLKVAPDDLKTFKTAVTAFNNGNTTATLTVLKGKHQDEAYQWATENGHFAEVIKEERIIK